MSEVFLTGGTGFIGGALLQRLLADGHSVRALVRSPAAAQAIGQLGADPIIGDVLDPESLRRGAAGCSVVFHVAGLNAMCLGDPSALERVNVGGVRAVVGAAAAEGVERIIYTSSAAAIGEPAGTTGTEATSHRGWYLTSYERSKHLAEVAAFEDSRRLGVDLIAVNPSSVQGPGRIGGTAKILIAYLRGRLRFAVDTTISLAFIDDVVEAHVAAESLGAAGERYLVSGWTVTVSGAIAALAQVDDTRRRVRYISPGVLAATGRLVGGGYRLLRRDAPLCPEMVRVLRHGSSYDGDRIVRDWGFAYTPPVEWLQLTVEWYRDRGIV